MLSDHKHIAAADVDTAKLSVSEGVCTPCSAFSGNVQSAFER